MSARNPDELPYKIILAELREDRGTIVSLIVHAQAISQLREQEERRAVADALLNALALSLHHVYSAIEACFEHVAKRIDEHMPTSGEWHADLLRQMALDIPGIRPAFISPELRRHLDDYRRFRHVVRKGYEHEYEWSRMKHLVDALPELRDALEATFAEFEQYLCEISSNGGEGEAPQ